MEKSCVSFIRGHFKEIFTLWAISLLFVLLCLFSDWSILLSSHFMVWRTKLIANHWWNHSMCHLWWAQESDWVWRTLWVEAKGERGLKRILGLFLSFFLVNLDCVTVFLFSSLTVTLLLGWYLSSSFFSCSFCVYFCLYTLNWGQLSIWEGGGGLCLDTGVLRRELRLQQHLSLTGREEEGRFSSFWSLTGILGVSPCWWFFLV